MRAMAYLKAQGIAVRVSSEGNNDTGSLEKDILTIVHCTFELDR